MQWVEVRDDFLKLAMPVNEETKQPDGILHGGASCFFSSRRGNTRLQGDWSSDVCSSDLSLGGSPLPGRLAKRVQDLARDEERMTRSEERRVGKEWRSRWSPYH